MSKPVYPHLLPEDVKTWHVFHELQRQNYDHFDYDIPVGQGRPVSSDTPENIAKMASFLSRRRIDVVGYQPDRLSIFEVTHTLGFTAMGQWLAYPALYQLTFEPSLPISAAIVTQRIETDLPPVLYAYEIEVWVVDPETGQMSTLAALIDSGATIPQP